MQWTVTTSAASAASLSSAPRRPRAAPPSAMLKNDAWTNAGGGLIPFEIFQQFVKVANGANLLIDQIVPYPDKVSTISKDKMKHHAKMTSCK
jgi:hypothetical protein